MRNKGWWLTGMVARILMLLAALLLLLSYASMVVNPAKAWYFTIFGLLFIPLGLLALVFFLWAIHRRSRMTGLLLVALLPAVFLIGRYYQFKAPEAEREPTLKIVSYNVGLFAHGNMGDKRLVLTDSIAAYLRRTDADIICLQEFYLPNTLNMDAWFRDRFPGYKAEYYVLTGEKGHAGNVTLSRRPVLYKGKIDFEKSTNLALHTDIQLDSTVLRFYNCHFESYNISLSGLVKSIGHREDNVMHHPAPEAGGGGDQGHRRLPGPLGRAGRLQRQSAFLYRAPPPARPQGRFRPGRQGFRRHLPYVLASVEDRLHSLSARPPGRQLRGPESQVFRPLSRHCHLL